MSRNIIEYPITIGEVHDTMLEAIRRDQEEARIGDEQGFILARIASLVFEKFTEEDFK